MRTIYLWLAMIVLSVVLMGCQQDTANDTSAQAAGAHTVVVVVPVGAVPRTLAGLTGGLEADVSRLDLARVVAAVPVHLGAVVAGFGTRHPAVPAH